MRINWQQKMIYYFGIFFLFCLSSSFFVSMAKAATFCVADPTGLQNALIVAASNGEDDIVQVVQGSYVGKFVYSSTEPYDVTIEGGYTGNCTSQVINPANTILDGDKSSSVLVLASSNGSNFTVQGLGLQNGDASSGGEANNGGGLYIKTAVGDVSVSNCAISGNNAYGSGGGVYVSSNTLTMTNNTISENNAAHSAGGGVYVSSDTLTMTNNTITGNTANSYGGGVYVSSDTLTMTNNTITGNTANSYGGGVYAYNHTLMTMTMTNNTITGNTANSFGGGVYISSDTLTMTNNTISENNAAHSSGGGVYVSSNTMTMTNNTISGNTANSSGGGVYVSSDTLTMTNNTISGNTANSSGGGVYAYSISSTIQHVVTMTNNTITGNTADNGGGLYLKLQGEGGCTYIYNNIIWSNIAITQGVDIYIDNDGDNDHLFSPIDIYNNDFDQSATGFYIEIPIIIDSSNIDNQDPLFKDSYCHLIAGSPCMDAGDNNAPGLPLSDMDGDNRIINGIVDIGADECFEISVGSVEINNVWKSVNLSHAWSNPIVIISPPTYHGAEPGIVRLRNVTSNSFDVHFQEWLYKDGLHTQENISYLVLSDGHSQMTNGSIWEAGTFSLSGIGTWTFHAFTDQFPSKPALFLTVQTYNGSDPIVVRARGVTNTGFEAALFEEENKMDGHTTEEVGYFAVYSPKLSGTVNINGTDVPYLLQAQSVDHRFVPVLSSDIKLEEERSKDSEVNHIDETISILALGDNIFAQDISSDGADTAAIRRLAPEYNTIMEWGTVGGVDQDWMKIPLAKEYLDPVVVAKPVSSHGGDPGVIRIRNVSHNSFELRYNEWAYNDGWHTQERVFYIVADTGIRSVAGLTVDAGKLDTSKLLADGWEPISFSATFSQTPSIFTSVQTYNGADPVTTRLSNCTYAGFDLTMDEEEAKNDGHITETLGWVAIERGTGNTSDNRSVAVLKDSTSSTPHQINFGQSMARRFPVVISDMITTYGVDPGFLRYQNLLPNSIDLFIQEEVSSDPEINHVMEDVSVFVGE